MTSFYGRLQRYQRRDGREPIEDFLTEALADLLGMMPAATAVELASEWFFEAGKPRDAWRKRAGAAKSLDWSTQYRIDDLSYRIDLLALADGLPLLGVEVKVWAGLQEHKAPKGSRVKTQTQLHSYGQWLARNTGEDKWPGALALLTLGSEPPTSFLNRQDASYGVEWRRVTRWCWVWSGLSKAANAALKASGRAADPSGQWPHWIGLALDFCLFLEERNMSAQTMTSADYALTESFVPTHQRLEATFTRFWYALQPIRTAHAKRGGKRMVFQPDGSLIWGWIYLKPSLAKKDCTSYIAIGLLFPKVENTFFAGAKPPLPDAPCVFVSWNNESEEERPELPTKAWSRADYLDVIAARPLSDFPALDGEARADAIGAWMVERVNELIPSLKASRTGRGGARRKAAVEASADDAGFEPET